MTDDHAAHISRMAAPIYAALLTHTIGLDGIDAPEEMLIELREQAIAQALLLWQQTLDTD